jgi:hypothetical protein
VVADTIAFDEETGRFSDIINEYAPALANPLTDYLASDPDDTFWEGRFKNTLEGLALGGITEGLFRTARYIKNKKQQINNEKFDQKILEEDEKFLNEKGEVDYQEARKANLLENKPKVNTKVKTEDLQAEIDDAVFNNFKKLQTKKVKGKNVQRTNEEFDQKLSLDEGLDLGISTARWKVLK